MDPLKSRYLRQTRVNAELRPFLLPLLLLLIASRVFAAGGHSNGSWVATWQGSPTPGGTLYSPGCPSDIGLSNQTIRNLVHVSAGGDWVRARISNNGGLVPLSVGSGSIGLASGSTAAIVGSLQPLLFGGQTSITIAAGGEAVSDPIQMTVQPLTTLSISVYLPGSTGPSTQHYVASQDNFLAPGDQTTSSTAGPFTQTISCWMFLSGVDVRPSSHLQGAIVALGDSITDGFLSTNNANRRYPDDLAVKLAAHKHQSISVVNAGISGNELLTIHSVQITGPGQQLLAGYSAPFRLGRDVLNQSGACAVILLEGINDIGDQSAKATDLIPVYLQIIQQVHDAGLSIYGGTLTPFGGSNPIWGGDYGTPAGEAQRQLVNAWIRTSGAFDGVFDFDEALRDPSNPTFLLPAYVGDYLHPNDAGYQAMADAVNLDTIIDNCDE